MRSIFIGDLHGCAREFEELLAKTGYQSGSDKLYLTGDAFTKGPDPLEIWNLIGATGAGMVLGNHDASLLDLLRARRDSKVGDSHLGERIRQTLDQLDPVVDRLIPWIEALPLVIRGADFTLVHAGVNPEGDLEGTERSEFLAIRLWPPATGVVGPRLHAHYQSPDERTLVFGHDAPGGLVVKRKAAESRPYLVGLDTGCVYGGALTAWSLEEDAFFSVKSRTL